MIIIDKKMRFQCTQEVMSKLPQFNCSIGLSKLVTTFECIWKCINCHTIEYIKCKPATEGLKNFQKISKHSRLYLMAIFFSSNLMYSLHCIISSRVIPPIIIKTNQMFDLCTTQLVFQDKMKNIGIPSSMFINLFIHQGFYLRISGFTTR